MSSTAALDKRLTEVEALADRLRFNVRDATDAILKINHHLEARIAFLELPFHVRIWRRLKRVF